MRQLSVNLDPWKTMVCVLIGGESAEVLQVVNDLGIVDDEPIPDSIIGRSWTFRGKPPVVWIRTWDIATLVHEFDHVVFGVLKFRGVTYSAKSEEAFTYTKEHALRQVFAEMQEPEQPAENTVQEEETCNQK